MLKPVRWNAWIAAVLTIGISFDTFAGITTDTSLGHSSQTLSGNMTIPQSMGLLSGNNLFHSFLTFNINTGESANFTTTTNGIANVISRVTGGSLSQINGQLSLTQCGGCSAPNFFFINPAGVTFGAGASVNVPGAFHVSTADYVKFPDGNYYADLSKASTFSVASPEAFGFLGKSRASITVNGGAKLSTQPTQPLSVVAGDVTLDNGTVSTLSGGDVRVAAAGQSATEVPFTGPLPAANGNLNILNGGNITADTATTATSGNVNVSAGNINVDGNGTGKLGISSTTSAAANTGNAGNVNVMATGNISLTNGAVINADTYSAGNGGAVTVNAANISVDGTLTNPNASLPIFGNDSLTSRISSQTNPDSTGFSSYTGNSGAVNVAATGNISLKNGGTIDADSNTSGNARPVTVSAGSATIDGSGSNSQIAYTGISSTAWGIAGNGGTVNVTTAGILSILNGGLVISDTWGAGNANAVTVNAGSIYIDGQGNASYTGIASQTNNGSTGNAGSTNVTTIGNLSIINGGNISSSTNGSGNASSVTVNAGSITIDGKNSVVFTGIASNANTGTGNAGDVYVTVYGNLSLINTGQIVSNTLTSGNAGSITVNADTLLVDGMANGYYSAIQAEAFNGSSGQTGNVTVAANSITLSNGGQITIQNLATVATPSALTPTSISVTAPRITILNDPNAITASSTGNVDAGSITINASNMLYLDPSGITTTANLGNGGGISINAGIISLNGSEITTSVTGLTGNGGNIAINANSLVLNTGFIQANTAAANASGGTVTIAAQNLIPSGNTLFLGGNTPYLFQPGGFGFNVIQAAAPTGVSGTVQTTSPTLDLSSSLSGLNTQQIDTGGLGRSPCQATGGSSLAPSGRGGLSRGLLRAELPLSATTASYVSPATKEDVRLALSDWSCS